MRRNQILKLLIFATGLLFSSGCVVEPVENAGWTIEQRVNLHTRLGIGYLQQGRLAAAHEEIEYALKLDSNSSGANHAMALLQIELGEPNLVDQHFEKALAGDPKDLSARNDYGMYLCESGRIEAGIEELKMVLLDPLNDAPYKGQYTIAVCFSKKKQYQKAAHHLSTALAARPENRFILYESAVVSYELGKFLSARGYLERYLEHGTPSADSLLLAVKNELRLGSNELVQLYAYQLRSKYPTSLQSQKARSLLRGEAPDG